MLEPIPDGLVVLTFDDATGSASDYVGPLLKDLGFGATFFITEGLLMQTDKYWYMTWKEIRGLHDNGFEIGSHNGRHCDITLQPTRRRHEDLEQIERRCEEYGIPRPKTFAYPGSHFDREQVDILAERGYRLARRGAIPEYSDEIEVDGKPAWRRGGPGILYDPSVDDPLLIPTAGGSGPDWTFEEFDAALEGARDGKIAVLVFHGVPDIHPHCSTEPDVFERWMHHIADRGHEVIALRALERFVDPDLRPKDPMAAIEARLAAAEG